MLVLVVGAKGGVGATTLAYELRQFAGIAVALDAGDGQFAALSAGMQRPADLSTVAQLTVTARTREAEAAARRGQVYVWSLACAAFPGPLSAYTNQLKALGPVIVDGGLAPPEAVAVLADRIFIVSRDQDPVAAWHEQRLKQRWPQAQVVVGDLRAAAQALGAECFGARPPSLVVRMFSTKKN